MDESQPARSVITNGRLTLEGLPAAYVQDLARPVILAAEALRFIGGYASRDGRLDETRRLEADARFIDGGLRRIGHEGTATQLRLSLRPLPHAGEESRLLLVIGWREAEREAPAFAEAFLPAAVFEALKQDVVAGLADELSLKASTSLWIREADHDRDQGRALDRYLGPDGEEGASAPARGFIETLEWQPRTRLAPAAEAAEPPLPEQPAPPAPAPQEELEDESAEELRRINWSLRQLLVLFAFLLIILAVK